MSGQFKVDDVAVFQNQVGIFAYLNNRECTVTGPLEMRDGLQSGRHPFYLVVSEDGEELLAFPSDLRKKPPKQSTDEWAESKVRDLIKPVVQPEREVA